MSDNTELLETTKDGGPPVIVTQVKVPGAHEAGTPPDISEGAGTLEHTCHSSSLLSWEEDPELQQQLAQYQEEERRIREGIERKREERHAARLHKVYEARSRVETARFHAHELMNTPTNTSEVTPVATVSPSKCEF